MASSLLLTHELLDDLVPIASTGIYNVVRDGALFERNLRERLRDMAPGIGRRIEETCKRSPTRPDLCSVVRVLAGRGIPAWRFA